jgi:hypothetical protein
MHRRQHLLLEAIVDALTLDQFTGALRVGRLPFFRIRRIVNSLLPDTQVPPPAITFFVVLPSPS